MTYKKIFLNIIILMSLLVFSCKSVNVENDNMYIMIYDYSNNTIQDVIISIDGEVVGKSDVYGRYVFSIPKITDEEEHLMKFEKNGYKPIEDAVTYKEGLVLYYKMGTALQFLEKAENELDNNNDLLALEYVNSSLEIQNRDDSLYLKCIILQKLQYPDAEIKKVYDLISNKNSIEKFPILREENKELNNEE